MTWANRQIVAGVAIMVLTVAFVSIAAGPAAGQGSDDGLRKIDSPRFGVAVRAPVAWSLVQWSEDDKAFVLALPQEKGSPAGHVTCELTLPPETLSDFQKRNQAEHDREQRLPAARRTLVSDDLEKIAAGVEDKTRPTVADPPGEKQADDAKPDRNAKPDAIAEPASVAQPGGQPSVPGEQRLVTVWELDAASGPKRFEVTSRLIRHEMLYTFTLLTDEAHFAAYRADFDELLASAKFSPPETGLQMLPGGYWLQRQFRFALRLPAAWKPAFGSSDKALLFARGETHGLFSDHLMVLASPPKPLDFPVLLASVPAAATATDPAAEVDSCQIVRLGTGKALETIVRTKRGDEAVTIMERRFMGQRHNYEVRVACLSATFKQQEAEIRKSLDSFREIADPPPAPAL